MEKSIKGIVKSLITIAFAFLIIIGYAKYAENQSRNKLENKETNIDMIFNIDENANSERNSDYNRNSNSKRQSKYEITTPRKHILKMIACASSIMFIISYVINKQMKTSDYRRETEGLISPILAESVVDRKIGLKELIMTSIIQLNLKENIKIINNQTIELISKDNLEEYEKGIVELLFKNNNIIEFKDINYIFTSSNRETLNFTKKLNEIKEAISNKIISLEIFSKNLTIINKIIGLCATLICINLPQIFLNMEYMGKIKLIFLILSGSIVVRYIKRNINKTTLQEEIVKNKERNKKNGTEIAILMIAILVMVIMNIAKCNIEYIITVIFILLLNVYVIHKSKKNVLTKKGKKEQLELIKLKNYITEYSLIKDRDLNSVIIWDNYLAYATAFGIPSKITNSIYEGWYNLNLNLQVIDAILK